MSTLHERRPSRESQQRGNPALVRTHSIIDRCGNSHVTKRELEKPAPNLLSSMGVEGLIIIQSNPLGNMDDAPPTG
jgi:hypothetical protein